MGVIEHFQDPCLPLKEAYRVTKKGGIAFITVPNKLSLWYYITKRLYMKFGKGDWLWQKEYTKWELKSFATSVGFKCIKSFNCNVRDSLRSAFLSEEKTVAKVPNPFYYFGGLLYWLGRKAENLLSLLGYHSVFVGEK